jgi:hypothetical protein
VKPKTGAVAKAPAKSAEPAATDDEPPKKKKRAAWDVKGRLQDLETYHSQTESRLEDSNGQITFLTTKLTESQTTSTKFMI